MVSQALPAAIGRVVKSNSHVDYVCRVYDRADVAPAPAEQFPFGGFVSLGEAIGVIYRSELVNPDYGFHGPRLAVDDAVRAVVTPDLLQEQATLLGLLLIGERQEGHFSQGIPKQVVPVHTPVTALADNRLLAFHRSADAKLQLAYYRCCSARLARSARPCCWPSWTGWKRCWTRRSGPCSAVLRTTISWQATLA